MVRYVLGVLIGVAVLVVLFGERADLVAARHEFGHLAVGWLAAAAAAEGASLSAFGFLQRRVLGLAGSRVALPGLVAVSLANEAIANTVPAGPALSCVYRYRFYRQRGATEASAGWTVFTVLIAQAISMSLVLLLGVLVAMLASASIGGAGIAAVGLVIVVAGGMVLARRDLVLRLIGAGVRATRRVTGHPGDAALARIEVALARMGEIPLSARSTASVVGIAVVVWACDFLCLLCGFAAVHAAVPWRGVLLAYGAAQVVSALPIVPGGLGIVEGSLAVILAAYGIARVPAILVALAYRLVSFWLSITVGWISAGGLAYRARRTRADITQRG
jgi:putative heme transporter